jgi:hypothetical protein
MGGTMEREDFVIKMVSFTKEISIKENSMAKENLSS